MIGILCTYFRDFKKKKEHTTSLMQKPATSLYHTIEAPASTSASAALHFHKAIAFQTTEDTKCIYWAVSQAPFAGVTCEVQLRNLSAPVRDDLKP